MITLASALSMTLLAASPAPLPQGAAITYAVRFPAPETHYVEIEAEIPHSGSDNLELMMAVWTPGSYLVREYARHVEGLTASRPDGEALEVTKTTKNRWRVEAGQAESVIVRYRLYCREMSVRTNFVDSSFAILNGAPTFVTAVGGHALAHVVRLELPAGWAASATALPAVPDQAHTYRARDYDELVDSPIYAGNPAIHEFAVDGVLHRLVNEGEGGFWDGPESAADTERIVHAHQEFWGSFPYPSFLFLNLITEARGGLEHRDSTVLMTRNHARRTREGALGWLGLVSHELFHAWNGKRLRPIELGPFDYETEVTTRGLWIVEGITSYYDDLLVHRAGLSTRKEYLEALSKTLRRLGTTPGRQVQPLAQASFDAWIKHYRRDENTANTAISYYTKGAVGAWLLDARIREATGDAKSLDDVMRLAYGKYSGETGFAPGEFEALANHVAGTDLSAFFHHLTETTEELELDPALTWFGLALEADKKGKKDADESDEKAGWLGAEIEDERGLLVVQEVRRGTPAAASGLAVEDEILALDGYRVTPDTFEDRLETYRPGQTTEITVTRRGRLIRLTAELGSEPVERFKLVVEPEASDAQRQRLEAWLGPEP